MWNARVNHFLSVGRYLICGWQQQPHSLFSHPCYSVTKWTINIQRTHRIKKEKKKNQNSDCLMKCKQIGSRVLSAIAVIAVTYIVPYFNFVYSFIYFISTDANAVGKRWTWKMFRRNCCLHSCALKLQWLHAVHRK